MAQIQNIQSSQQMPVQQPQMPPNPNPTQMQVVSEPKKSKWWIWLIVILIVIIAGGAVYYFFLR